MKKNIPLSFLLLFILLYCLGSLGQQPAGFNYVTVTATPTPTPAVTYTFRSANHASDNVTCPKPTGTAEGDFMIAQQFVYGDTTITGPSGWAKDYQKDLGGGNTFIIWSKLAGASEPESYSWSGYSGGYIGEQILTYQVSGGTPAFDKGATNVAESTADSATITANTLVTALDGELILYLMVPADAVTWTSPSGVTEREEYDTMASAEEIQATAGTSTARTFTKSVSGTAWRGVSTVAYK